MTNWKTQKLSLLCTKIGSGSTPRGGDASYKSHGISLIRSQNVLDFSFSKGGLAFIDEKQAKELANVELKERDVLLNITGDSVARVCQVPDNILPARVNQHVAILRANIDILNPEYLKYYLLANSNKERLLSLASIGATRKALTKGMLEEFDIAIPDEKGTITQTRIASILSSIDNKIELNHRTNQTLEQMAQALFQKYFVDGVDPENLPEGWTLGKVGDIISIQNGFAFKGTDFKESGNHGIIKIKNINNNVVDIHNTQYVEDKNTSNLKNTFRVFGGDILIAMTGAEVGKIGVVPTNKKTLWLNQRVGKFQEKILSGNLFSFLLLTTDSYQTELQTTAMGSAQPNISGSDIENIKTIVPATEKIAEFGKTVMAMFDKICRSHQENYMLSNFRDSLLPKLMNGEIELN